MKTARTNKFVMDLRKGAVIEQNDQRYVITHTLSVTQMMVRHVTTGESLIIDVSKMGPPRPATAASQPQQDRDLQEVEEGDWAQAEVLRDAIEQSLVANHGSASYERLAQSVAVSRAKFYKLRKQYLESGRLLSSLLHPRRIGGRGKSRLPDAAAAIVNDRIKNFHLTNQQPSDAALIKEIRRICSNAGLPLPARTTVLRHLQWIDQRERISKRRGAYAATQRFDPIDGSVPGADWPLAVVQMDHTPLPVIIVDEKYRKPINRAWITVAIDCFSRVALGTYVSLDAPSTMSAGLCMGNCILPKEKWLQSIAPNDGIEWPYYGTPERLHMDNAKEFRGNMLQLASREYQFDLEFRPVKKPNYGGHIERLMGTLSEALKVAPGATFANPDQRGEYDSEGRACMTLAELERWLALTFAAYHLEPHSALGTSPNEKWRQGIFGTDNRPGRGIPPRFVDDELVRIDFMPFEERTIQAYGVSMDLLYFHDVLRSRIGLTVSGRNKAAPTYRFRRDPRDISHIYFFDDETRKYVAIPYKDSSHPPASIWEWRAAVKLCKEQGISTKNEREVFRLINLQREQANESAEKTKAARRTLQKLAEHTKVRAQKQKELPQAFDAQAPADATQAAAPHEDRYAAKRELILPFTDD